jgi:hypothetical protein
MEAHRWAQKRRGFSLSKNFARYQRATLVGVREYGSKPRNGPSKAQDVAVGGRTGPVVQAQRRAALKSLMSPAKTGAKS